MTTESEQDGGDNSAALRASPRTLAQEMKSELLELAANLSEVGLDSILDDGLLKDVPIVGSLIGLAKIGQSLRDHYYLKKLGNFLGPLAELSNSSRKELLSKLDSKPEFQRELEDLIAAYIDQFDTGLKARYLGVLLVSFLKDEIGSEDFFRTAYFIRNAFWKDLEKLENVNEGEDVIVSNWPIILDGIASSKSSGNKAENVNGVIEPNYLYPLTPLGKHLKNCLVRYSQVRFNGVGG